MNGNPITVIFTDTRGGMDLGKASEEAHKAAAKRMTDFLEHMCVTAYTAQAAPAITVAAPYFAVVVTITVAVTAVDTDVTTMEGLELWLDGTSPVNPRLF